MMYEVAVDFIFCLMALIFALIFLVVLLWAIKMLNDFIDNHLRRKNVATFYANATCFMGVMYIAAFFYALNVCF